MIAQAASFAGKLTLGLVGSVLALPAHAITVNELVPGQIWISEFMPDPSAVVDSTGEWIELANPLAASIDLAGLVIKSGSESYVLTAGAGTTLASGGYFLLGRSATSNSGIVPNQVWSSIVLSNSSDSIQLENGLGQTLFSVSWTGSTAGKSYSLQTVSPPYALTAANYYLETVISYNVNDFGTPGSANSIATIGSAPPVPEPETWAMLLAGLGLVGVAARHRG
jgi:hypothetical protein